MHWLLLRGLVREKRHWGGFPVMLEQARPGDSSHCLDLAGVGTEHQRPALSSIPDYAEDLRRRWLELKKDGDAWGLICISLGGMIGLHWTHAHPNDFDCLVVINTSARNLGPVWKRLRPGAMRHFGGALMARDLVARERLILKATSNGCPDPEATATRWACFAREAPVRYGAFAKQLLAGARFRAPATASVPSLILVSAGDRLVHPDSSRRLAQRWGAEIREHSTAGHDLSLDAPEWIIEQINSFDATRR